MANADLKQLAKEKGVYLWQVAQAYGISDGNFSRKLRRELPDSEKTKIRFIIESIKTGETNV